MRKQILSQDASPRLGDELDIPAIASALVTSEAPDHPIENAFDADRGPGGSRWVAAMPGEQTLILAFDVPQTIRQVIIEVEETQMSRTQELALAVSSDGGGSYRELLRQEYNFAPPATTSEREQWTINADGVTHLRLQIKPDKGNRPALASLTSLSVS